MDPAEMIIAALAMGAASGITESTASAAGAAYANLRSQFRAWLASRRANPDGVVEPVDSAEARQRALELLRHSDLEQVAALAAAADRLLLVLDPDGHRRGKYGVAPRAEFQGSVQQTAHAHDNARVFQVGSGTQNINER